MTSSTNKVVYWGTGRRKTSVAIVRLTPGKGEIIINGRPGDHYLNFNPAYISLSLIHISEPTRPY